jgi:hypothetical protein
MVHLLRGVHKSRREDLWPGGRTSRRQRCYCCWITRFSNRNGDLLLPEHNQPLAVWAHWSTSISPHVSVRQPTKQRYTRRRGVRGESRERVCRGRNDDVWRGLTIFFWQDCWGGSLGLLVDTWWCRHLACAGKWDHLLRIERYLLHSTHARLFVSILMFSNIYIWCVSSCNLLHCFQGAFELGHVTFHAILRLWVICRMCNETHIMYNWIFWCY